MFRLFAAVVPPPSILEEMRKLQRPQVKGVRWTTPEQWHVTLRFFGDVPLPEVPAVVDALSNLDVSPVNAHLHGPAATFKGKVLHLPVDGLQELFDVVDAATTPLFGKEKRPFHGHLTLARSDRVNLNTLTDIELVEGQWTVDEVLLFRSTITTDGSVYERVADLPIA